MKKGAIKIFEIRSKEDNTAMCTSRQIRILKSMKENSLSPMAVRLNVDNHVLSILLKNCDDDEDERGTGRWRLLHHSGDECLHPARAGASPSNGQPLSIEAAH
jgi:hypothetical protein